MVSFSLLNNTVLPCRIREPTYVFKGTHSARTLKCISHSAPHQQIPFISGESVQEHVKGRECSFCGTWKQEETVFLWWQSASVAARVP